MSECIITRRGGSGGLSPNSAVIHVIAQAGSTITFTKGGVVAKTLGPDKSHVNAGDADKADWFYSVSPANYGEWTVTASLVNVGSGSYDVTVSAAKTYDVDISLGYLIYRNGWQHGYRMETITNVYDPNHTYAVDNDANPPCASTTRGNWGFALNNLIDVTDYNTLYVEIAQQDYTGNYRGLFGLWNQAHANARAFSDSSGGGATVYYQKNSGIPRAVYTLDVSGLTGGYVFKAQQKYDGQETKYCAFYLYDMYLSKEVTT